MQTLRQNHHIVRKRRIHNKEKIRFVTFPPIPDKLYFSIGEASRLCFIEPYVIRFWERVFSQLKPAKVSVGGRRYYGKEEIVLMRLIRDLLYTQGFTTAGAKMRLASIYASTVVRGNGGDGYITARDVVSVDGTENGKGHHDVVKRQQLLMEQKQNILRGLNDNNDCAQIVTDDDNNYALSKNQEQSERNELVRKNLLKDILAHVNSTLSSLGSELGMEDAIGELEDNW